MKSWIKKYIGVVTIMACLSPISSAQPIDENIKNSTPEWVNELKRINPKDYELLNSEIQKVVEKFPNKAHITQGELKQFISEIQKIYQKPEIGQMLMRYASYYGKADDETVIKFTDARVRMMNRLLAHDDVACYDWLHQNVNPDIMLVAEYESLLFKDILTDILKNYDPNRKIPSKEDVEDVMNLAVPIALNQIVRVQKLGTYVNNKQIIDTSIFEKTKLSNREKRQFCEFHRNLFTYLLLHRKTDALRYLSED